MKCRLLLHSALAFVLNVQLTGCIAAYTSTKKIGDYSVQSHKQLASVKFSHDVQDPLLRLALVRTLRGRSHVLDVKSAGGNEPGRFLITGRDTNNFSSFDEAWLLVSFISFGVIPAVVDSNHLVSFTVISPGGEEATYRYRYVERITTWLPFVLFGPDLVVLLVKGDYDYWEDRVTMLDEIAAQFVAEATTFILSHSTQ